MRAAGIGELLKPPRNKWQEFALLLPLSEAQTFARVIDKVAKSDELDHTESSLVNRIQDILVSELG